MKLHYSQTLGTAYRMPSIVSVPYEITLLSNVQFFILAALHVSVPYEITLLSNLSLSTIRIPLVSVPYEITLLSNYCNSSREGTAFQYLMKLHYSQTYVVL